MNRLFRGRQLLGLSAVVLLALAASPVLAQPASGQTPAAAPAKTPYYLGSPVMDVGWTPGESPSSATEEIEDIFTPKEGAVDLRLVERPLAFLQGKANELADNTGLRLASAYTMLFQQLSGGPGDRYGGAGDFDVMSTWTLVGRGTENPGRFIFTFEDRFKIGSQPPSVLGRVAGTLIATTNAFNDRGWVIRDAYWSQRLLDGQLRFILGRADPSDFVGAHWLMNVNNSFVNRHFSGSPAMPSPGHGPSAGVSYRPEGLYYVTAGVSSAYGNTTQEFVSLKDLFTFGEIGITPTFEGLGRGRFAVSPWHMDAREADNLPSSWGLTVVADQELSERFQLFGRYAYSDATLTNIRQMAQAGMGLRCLNGSADDLAGLAFSIAIPRDHTAREEKVLEAFYRVQLSAHAQVSAGAQAIFDPSNAPTSGTIGVFYGRLRVAF
jgi:porin